VLRIELSPEKLTLFLGAFGRTLERDVLTSTRPGLHCGTPSSGCCGYRVTNTCGVAPPVLSYTFMFTIQWHQLYVAQRPDQSQHTRYHPHLKCTVYSMHASSAAAVNTQAHVTWHQHQMQCTALCCHRTALQPRQRVWLLHGT
jgi:hypothetical protein